MGVNGVGMPPHDGLVSVYRMSGMIWGVVNNASENIRAVQSRLVSHPTAAI